VHKQNTFQRHLLAYLYCMVAFCESVLIIEIMMMMMMGTTNLNYSGL